MIIDINDKQSIETIQPYLNISRLEGKRIGLTSGCFDTIHSLHASFIRRCLGNCDILIVGVDCDEMVAESKGPTRPIIPDFQRVIMVDMMKPVSFAFIMYSVNDFGRAAKIFTPDIIFKNDEFKGRESEIIGREYAKEIRILPDQVDHSSTTDIVRHVITKNGS